MMGHLQKFLALVSAFLASNGDKTNGLDAGEYDATVDESSRGSQPYQFNRLTN
ncbi:hypothetical protein AB3R30_19760 [Leptolyngbyaceae cyanobacterium UHCC 1019]